ncbi:hypothetical protein AVDCRST_MAG94-1515, partial [uncultured Leptolyngbya sp.]
CSRSSPILQVGKKLVRFCSFMKSGQRSSDNSLKLSVEQSEPLDLMLF